MGRPSRYSPELRERGVRLVREHGPEYPSQWAAITSIAGKLSARTRRRTNLDRSPSVRRFRGSDLS
jgi:hypothetical protein